MSRLHLNFTRITAYLSFLLLSVTMAGQQNQTGYPHRHGDLLEYAKLKNQLWIKDKERADALADQLGFPKEYIEPTGRVVILQGLGPGNRPVYYATDNIQAADIISTDLLWTGEYGDSFLTGAGVEINVWDGGAILSSHQEFQNGSEERVEMRNKDLSISNHSTHVAGTMGASGVVPESRGMAGQTKIYGWGFSNDFSEMALAAADGMILSNHSYGSLNGWYHDPSYDVWYWYGDIKISESTDYQFGFYNQLSADLDFITWSAPRYLVVKSAGNDRGDTPESQPVTHMVWDEKWVSSSVVRNPDGGPNGYDCLTPMSVAKNILTIGAVDDLASMTSFSGFGPCDDGRIKPDLVANGTTVFSSMGPTAVDYGSYNGTSMATASVTGSMSLLYQLQEMLQPGVKLHSSTMKGLLIHTAKEAGQAPGPDYQFGWGLVDMKAASGLMELNAGSGGLNIREGILSEGEVMQFPVKSFSSSPWLKVTLCWTDPAGDPSSPALNPRNKNLVNDLDLSVESMGTTQQYHPWILDVENPELPATTGENHVDNVEQVFIPNPGSADFNVRISHSGILSGGSQEFSLVISGISVPEDTPAPTNLRFSAYQTSVLLKWDAPADSRPQSYHIYRDGKFLAETEDLAYQDLNLVTDREYIYYVTAQFEWDGNQVESLQTNQVTATPRTIKPLPFTIDFEHAPEEIAIKNSFDGWQWGDGESLSSYYLRFASNETHFIAARSYTAGETSHVTDIATTLPLQLANYSNVKLTFDYMLVTGLYASIDELHVVFKVPEDEEWHQWENLPLALTWSEIMLELPEEAYANGTQIGFYYDDFYQWGMGASLDNISITGTADLTSDLSITTMTEPVSSCILSDVEDVTVNLMNAGGMPLLPGETIEIHMGVSGGTSLTDVLILTNALAPGEILAHTMSTSLDMSEPGSYQFDFTISYKNDNNILNNSLITTVEAGGIPETAILNTDLSFCLDADAVQIQVLPEGGTLAGPGVTGLLFYPSAAGVGTHTLTYKYAHDGGCWGTSTVQVEVIALPQPAILNSELSFREDDPPVLIEVYPEEGLLAGPGISGYIFDPSVAGSGQHTITYTFTDPEGCTGLTSQVFLVTDVIEPSILNKDLVFCIDEPSQLIRVYPPGGTLEGPGITGMYFEPSKAGVGTHEITYTCPYEAACTGTVSAWIRVIPLPDPVILNQDLVFCENDQPIRIVASPNGGILAGPGVLDCDFIPADAGPGLHMLTYTFGDGNGCIQSVDKQIQVKSAPAVYLGPDLEISLDDTIVLKSNVNASSFLWFNGSLANHVSIIAEELGVGTFDIWLMAMSNDSCFDSDSILLSINQVNVIKQEANREDFSLYPNPVDEGFYLKLNGIEKADQISLLSQTGQVYMNKVPSSYPYFDVSYLLPGSYILKVQTESRVVVLKFIKN